MEHEEYRDLIPAYSIGATDTDEALRIEAHLRDCADCRALLADYRRLEEQMLWSVPPTTAPARLSHQLRQQLQPETRRPRFSLPRWRMPALAGIALALLLLVATNVYWLARVSRTEDQLVVQATAMAALAGAPRVELTGDAPAPDAHGYFYFEPDTTVALLHTYDLPPLDEGKTYQLWLIRDGQRDSGGLFSVSGEGEAVLLVRAPRSLGEYQGVGVTVEPAGGSPAPTSPRVLGGPM